MTRKCIFYQLFAEINSPLSGCRINESKSGCKLQVMANIICKGNGETPVLLQPSLLQLVHIHTL